MDSHIQRHLRIEELYQALIVLIPEHTIDRISETAIRGKLDAILSMGKIEGRLTTYNGTAPFEGSPEDDRLIEGWQRIVDSVS